MSHRNKPHTVRTSLGQHHYTSTTWVDKRLEDCHNRKIAYVHTHNEGNVAHYYIYSPRNNSITNSRETTMYLKVDTFSATIMNLYYRHGDDVFYITDECPAMWKLKIGAMLVTISELSLREAYGVPYTDPLGFTFLIRRMCARLRGHINDNADPSWFVRTTQLPLPHMD